MKALKPYIIALIIIFITFFTVFSATEQVFFDDFETDRGWTFNPYGTDDATSGMWERANPEGTYYQLNVTPGTGYNDLVTGALAGSSYGSYDIDDGKTSIRSPDINIPDLWFVTLSFKYYLAHAGNSSSDDYLRVKIVDGNGDSHLVFEELGASNTDYPSWKVANVDISGFKNQTVYLLIEAADESNYSLVEAGIDDVLIESAEDPICGNGVCEPGETPESCMDCEGLQEGYWIKYGLDKIRPPHYYDVYLGYGPSYTLIKSEGGLIEVKGGSLKTKIHGGGIETNKVVCNQIQNDGTIYARKVIVTLNDFPDYVFAKSYKLKALAELEKYILENGRLPGLPSEQEVKENGLSIGDMQTKLLERIEIMTLHMIQMQKRIDELEAKLK